MPTHYGSKDVGHFLVSGRDLLGSQTDLTHDRKALIVETTPIGVEWPTAQYLNKKRVSLTQDGFFDHASGAANDAICDREGVEQVLCLTHLGNVAGRAMHAAAGAFAGTYKRILTGEHADKAHADYTVTGDANDAVILQALAALTTSGNTEGASVDAGASSASGGSGYLQVTALTLGGYTSVTFKVRHSADNITFADILTFTVVPRRGRRNGWR